MPDTHVRSFLVRVRKIPDVQPSSERMRRVMMLEQNWAVRFGCRRFGPGNVEYGEAVRMREEAVGRMRECLPEG